MAKEADLDFSKAFNRILQARAAESAASFIYTEVQDWRGSEGRAVALKRWLWELLQNATDCAKGGPFSFRVMWKPTELKVWHNAGPFRLREIVALVEGNSSKERRSAETTGRFGKGFLVTHVISTEVRVRGGLKVDNLGLYSFNFLLSRGGSEKEILHNIDRCAKALDDAVLAEEGSQDTEFIYSLSPKDESQVDIQESLRRLRIHAPYLFAFIPELRELTFTVEGTDELTFRPLKQDPVTLNEKTTGTLVAIKTPEKVCHLLAVASKLPTSGSQDISPSIAVEICNKENCREIAPPNSVTKVFQDLPLHGTIALLLPVVVNLPRTIDVDSTRSGPDLAKPGTRQAVTRALELLPTIVEWASREKIGRIHLLANLGTYHEDDEGKEKRELWQEIVFPVLQELLSCPIVETPETGFVKPREAVFPNGLWLELGSSDLFLLRGTRDLLELRGAKVPTADSVTDWEKLICTWKTVIPRPPIKLVDLGELFSEIENCKTLEGVADKFPTLKSKQAELKYICEAFRLAAEYCDRHRITAPTDLQKAAVIPNQHGILRMPSELSLDGGIDEILKEISTRLRMIPLKTRLVHSTLADSPGARLVLQLCGNRTLDTQNAVGELVTTIETQASDSGRRPEAGSVKRAATDFLVWYSAHESSTAVDLRPFPLLCADGELRPRVSIHDLFLLPSRLIPDEQRQWLDLFPEFIRLSEDYLAACERLHVDAFEFGRLCCARGIAAPELVFERKLDIGGGTLASLLATDGPSQGHHVESLDATDMPGLSSLLSSIAGASASGAASEAEKVLTLVLSCLVKNDTSWNTPVSVDCVAKQPHDCSGRLSVYPCSWLGKIKTVRWVPSGESGSAFEGLNSQNIKIILAKVPSALCESPEAREFLAMHFKVDRLDLAIRAAGGDDLDKQTALRNQWAEIVNAVQPGEVLDIVRRRKSASEINSRNNKLGRIVERLVGDAFAKEGFTIKPTGVGSDFRATLARGDDPDWDKENVGRLEFTANYSGRAVEFLVEVKATRGDSVRMSWLQADAAAGNIDQYILCVVDFNSRPDLFEEILSDEDPTCEIIAPCVKVVPEIGTDLVTAVQSLTSAMEAPHPGIVVEKADEIRFRILRKIWTEGQPLQEWAQSVRSQLSKH
jgi:hypothetical protein